jgi:hypothetical protein
MTCPHDGLALSQIIWQGQALNGWRCPDCKEEWISLRDATPMTMVVSGPYSITYVPPLDRHYGLTA